MYFTLKTQNLSWGCMIAIVVAFSWRTHGSWVFWKIGCEHLQPTFMLWAATAERKPDQNIFSLLHHENVNPEMSL